MKPSQPHDQMRDAFLAGAGWRGAEISPLAGDASTRSYERVELNDRSAVLMTAPPAAETAACPPEASEGDRRALGYNAMARLAGPNLNAYVAIAEALRASGLSAPKVYAADPETGFALIEDLGDDLFVRAVYVDDEAELYAAAVDVLLALRASPPARPHSDAYQMLDYDRLALKAEFSLLSQWYWPLKTAAPMPQDLHAEYLSLFGAAVDKLSAPHTIVLRDYHAENLLWLPARDGVRRVGLLDFQDGLYGAAAYDLASLLEDARRDVSSEIREAMIARYCDGAADGLGRERFDREAFMRDYAILAAQRNAKILGIFARLANRDGKARYLDFLPRVEAHFRRDLARPGLEDLHAFFTANFPDLGE